ncbi:MAG: ABC transporter ATP-binding protein [Geminicoccaceae bacterium]
MSEPVLAIRDLEVAFRVKRRELAVLRQVGFSIGRGEAYGLVGESGCGKSTVALTAVRYLPPNGRVTAGSISVDGRDVLAMGAGELQQLRARKVAMVYQDPGKALNPSLRVGRQLRESFEINGLDAAEAGDRALAMLRRVHIADPGSVMDRYPHQLSGGMQQRVCIAAALSADPALLILDEPTTGLDATVEAEVLDLIAQLRRELSTSILFISHNLAVVARMCDRVGVLYAGTLVEEGATDRVFHDPHHPYTVALLRCLPRPGQRKDHGRLDTIPGFLPSPGEPISGCAFAARCALADERCRTERPQLREVSGRLARCHHAEQAPGLPRSAPSDLDADVAVDRTGTPLLDVQTVAKTFGSSAAPVHALKDVQLAIWPGETLGLVGESGSGKSTFAKVLLGLAAPDPGGHIWLDGKSLAGLLGGRPEDAVKALQIVFQNPDSALNRAHSVRRIVGRALHRLGGLTGRAERDRTVELVNSVRLADRYLDSKPRQLSGGLKQRVAIARAFAGEPKIVVCDEPTSALDVSVQAAILNLLAELQARYRVSYLFISHDVAVVRYLADRIAVLYLGRIMEIGPSEQVIAGPHHPYTHALISAVPSLEGDAGDRIRLEGDVPSALDPPSGCVFHTRCRRKIGPICEQREPPLRAIGTLHEVRCHLPLGELDRAAERIASAA